MTDQESDGGETGDIGGRNCALMKGVYYPLYDWNGSVNDYVNMVIK